MPAERRKTVERRTIPAPRVVERRLGTLEIQNEKILLKQEEHTTQNKIISKDLKEVKNRQDEQNLNGHTTNLRLLAQATPDLLKVAKLVPDLLKVVEFIPSLTGEQNQLKNRATMWSELGHIFHTKSMKGKITWLVMVLGSLATATFYFVQSYKIIGH